ncbi:hypothetical protein MY4824_009929 [Beauveria thailandica]
MKAAPNIFEGEEQRVANARTILKYPRIIMLDEATSAPDSQTPTQQDPGYFANLHTRIGSN